MTRWNFDEITKTRTTDEGLPNKQRIWFHLFNKHGAVAEWRKACDEIDAAVDAGKLKSGAILAYGSLNEHHYNKLVQVSRYEKPKTFPTNYHIEGLRKDAKRAREIARGEG